MSDTDSKGPSHQLRETMDDAVNEAQTIARGQAEAATEAATTHVEREATTAANAAEAAAAQFPTGSLQQQAAHHMSAGLHDIADLLRRTDFDRAAGTVTRFARENPVAFLGGAALLGFATVRFLKSSAPEADATAETDPSDPWTGHVSATPAPTNPTGVYNGSRGAVENGRAAS